MFRLIPFGSLLLSLFLQVSCGIPSVKEPVKKQLVIASDFLDYRDRSLFKEFSKQHNTVIHILNMPVDSILGKLKKEGYTTRIDLVILQSSLDLCSFQENGLLQRLLDPSERPALPYRFRDRDNCWFGLAMDPYIIVQKQDSLKRLNNYTDLTKSGNWTTDLIENSELTALFTPFAHRYRETKGNGLRSMVNACFDREINFQRPGDSTYYFPPLLTKYSQFYSDSTLYRSGYRKARIVFPGQNKGGVHYELRGAGIVKQARNYSAAVVFLNYYTQQRNNEKLNNWWNTFPVTRSMDRAFTYQNKRFKVYPVATSDLCAYKVRAEAVIRSTRKK